MTVLFVKENTDLEIQSMRCASASFLYNGAHTVSTSWGNLWALHSHTDTVLRGSLAHPRDPSHFTLSPFLLFSFTFSFLVLMVSASIKSVGYWVCCRCSDCIELESPPLSFVSYTCAFLFLVSPLASSPPRTEPPPQPHPHLRLSSFTAAPVLSALELSSEAPMFTWPPCLGCCFH